VPREALALLEQQSRQGHIDLFYADESQVSPPGYVPYGWQFEEEQVCIASAQGKGLNCFALISRDNRMVYATSQETITASFIAHQLEKLSFSLTKLTVVVLDNARVHTATKINQALDRWQQRGLFLFYLPPYSPHLNMAERLWKELKARWLKPEDFRTPDNLFFAVNMALAAVGKQLFIQFNEYSL
jgi:transposase